MNSSQVSANVPLLWRKTLLCGAQSAMLAVVLNCASGCVSVHITGSEGKVQTIQRAGFVTVQMAVPDQAIVGSLTGFGVIGAPMGWSIGYTRQRWALIGDGCRAVIWVTSRVAIEDGIRSELGRLAGVCLLEEGAASFSTTSTEVLP